MPKLTLVNDTDQIKDFVVPYGIQAVAPNSTLEVDAPDFGEPAPAPAPEPTGNEAADAVTPAPAKAAKAGK